MLTPIHSTSAFNNYDSSLKITLFSAKPSDHHDFDTMKCSMISLDKQKSSKSIEDFPLRKLFKCGTDENLQMKPKKMDKITSKHKLYLCDYSDKTTIKSQAMLQPHSSNDLQNFTSSTIESEFSMKTFSKLDTLMTNSQKKIFKFTSSKFEMEFPNEPDTREVLTEENALKLLKKLFFQNYLFWNVDEKNIKSALPFIFLKKFKPQATILSQSQIATNFFIIQSGIIVKSSMKNGSVVTKYLDKGKMFGEKSLFDQMKRTSNYVSEGNCLLWGINIATFFKLLTTANQENFNENRMFLNKISVFKIVDSHKKDEIALNIYEQKFQKKEVILQQGSVCACCFILKKGELLLKNSERKIEKVFRAGEYIGDWSLNSFFFPSFLEVSNKEEATLLVISNKKLRSILGDNLYSLNWKNLSRLAFAQSSFFSKFSSETIEKLINNLEISCFEKNQVICPKGSPIDSLYIALDGNLRKTSENLEENEIIAEDCALFGEPYLLMKSSLKKEESVIMDDNGILGEISKTNIERILGMKLNESAEKLLSLMPKISITTNSEKKIERKIDKNDIEVIELAGDGQFGLVFLIRLKDEFFALKICAKAYIISRRFELYLINEKIIQSSLGEFPFLIKFHQSFQDENLVFFLMEYVNGKDLSTVLYGGKQTFSSDVARFYIAQLILTVEYLHSKDIVHRDIKLNNILVDQDGYIKLVDFGIAKMLKNGNRTFTIVGTPHYMAPEIIIGKGYDFSCDYWAIGVCFFELLFGFLPYGENSEDPIEVYNSIISSKQAGFDRNRLMELPYGTLDVLNKFLCKDVNKRFGSVKNDVKEHSWFNLLDWKELMEKNMKPYHVQKEKNVNAMKGKKLIEYLETEEIQNYLKKEERKMSKILNWDENF